MPQPPYATSGLNAVTASTGASPAPSDNLKIWRMYEFARPFRWQLFLALLCLLIATGLGLTFPNYLSKMLAAAGKFNDIKILNQVLKLMFAALLAQAIFKYGETYLLSYVGERILLNLRTKLYNHLQNLSLEFFARQQVGELLSRLSSDILHLRNVLTTHIGGLISQSLMLLGSLVIMFRINARLTLFLLTIVPPVALLSSYFSKRIKHNSRQVQDQLAMASVVAEEGLRGVLLVKSFGRERYQGERYVQAVSGAFQAAMRVVRNHAIFQSSMNCLGFAALGGAIWYGGIEVLAKRLTVEAITGFVVYGFYITGSVQAISSLVTQAIASFGGVRRVFELLDLSSSVQDAPGAFELASCQGNLSFQGVTFAYEPGIPVIHDLTLDIRSGEVLAIVGPSGAGKSTLINLTARFYDPTEGSVLLDGHDLRTLTQASIRSHLAIVPQDTMLFGATIRENLRFGRLDATEKEMVEAAKDANAHDFIMELPNQYDHLLGERGITLSGGQRQRLAIARAILKDPKILLLDEATSALDNESEGLVQESLNRLMKQNRTTLIIAHRLSTLKVANRIAVIDRGRLVELGTHENLLKLDGLYARLYSMQFRTTDQEGLGIS